MEALNTAWNTKFTDFDDLYQPIRDASAKSEAAKKIRNILKRDASEACLRFRQSMPEVDPNHMILGMRWAYRPRSCSRMESEIHAHLMPESLHVESTFSAC